MPVAAPIAAALTDHSAHPYALYIGGRDYMIATGGNAPGVPIDTVTIDQQGAGGVSSMDFTLEDPTGSITIPEGTPITFWNLANNDCYFYGFPDRVPNQPFAGYSRKISVSCTGIEAALDWSLIGSLVITSFTSLNGYNGDVGTIAAQFISQFGVLGIWGLGASSVATNPMGSETQPIGGDLVNGDGLGQQLVLPISGGYPHPGGDYSVTFTNTSLRTAIETIVAAGQTRSTGTSYPVLLTVDTLGRVRMFCDAPGLQPSDYATLVVSDTYGSTPSAANLEHVTEYGDNIHSVYVTGANATASGYFGDGSGIQGRIGQTSTTGADAEAAQGAAATFFQTAPTTAYRGSFDLEDITPTAHVWPGSLLTLTDTAAGATGSYRIGSIKRTFSGTRETWHVTYGRLAPSGIQLMRRLTRTTPF